MGSGSRGGCQAAQGGWGATHPLHSSVVDLDSWGRGDVVESLADVAFNVRPKHNQQHHRDQDRPAIVLEKEPHCGRHP